jgi:hypothetical protein
VRQFWGLVKSSAITQWMVALTLTATICYMAATGKPIPDLLAYGFTSVLSFAFGAKVAQAIK